MRPSNSSISFTFAHSTNPQDKIADQMVARYKGKQLDNTSYNFAIKILKPREMNNIQVGQSLKVTKNWVWLKIANDRDGDNHAWIKIQKSDLTDKLGIKNEELESISTAKDLQALMANKVMQTLRREDEDKLRGGDKLITTFIKSLLCFFVVSPIAKDIIREQISTQDQTDLSNGLEELYITGSKNLLDNVKKNLEKENPNALLFFGDEKISEIIDEVLIEEVNKKLNDKKLGWDERKFEGLNLLRLLNFYKENPDELIKTNKLLKIDPSDIPLEELAKIPVPNENIEILSNLWKKIASDFYSRGKLNDLVAVKDERNLLLKGNYALKFAEAYFLMPDKIKDNLKTFFEDLEENNKFTNILYFAVQYSDVGERDALSSIVKEFKTQQAIYQSDIKPFILDLIDDAQKVNAVPNLIRAYLAFDDTTIEIKSDDIWQSLDPSNQISFPTERIETLFRQEIERILVVDYHLTLTQLKNIQAYQEKSLREKEEEILKQKIELRNFTEELRDCESPEDIFNFLEQHSEWEKSFVFPFAIESGEMTSIDRLKVEHKIKMAEAFLTQLYSIDPQINTLPKDTVEFVAFRTFLENSVSFVRDQLEASLKADSPFRRTPSKISHLLISPEIIQEIKEGQSAPFLSAEQQEGLMNFDFLLNNQKLNHFSKTTEGIPPPLITSREAQATYQFLNHLKNDKEFIQVLEGLKGNKLNPHHQEILNDTPAFLRPLVKKLFSIPDVPTSSHKIPAGISEDTVNFLLEYVKRSEKIAKSEADLATTLDKAETLLKKLEEAPDTITNEDKLTLKELGVLDFSTVLNKGRFSSYPSINFMSELTSLGLHETDPLMKQFSMQSEKALKILSKLEVFFEEEKDNHYQETDIFAQNLRKEEKWKNRPLDFEMKMLAFFSNGLAHGAKLYRDEQGKIGISHVISVFEKGGFVLDYLWQSDVWRMNLGPLVPIVLQAQLRQVYGENWKEEIDKMYKGIEDKIHQNDGKLSSLENDIARRVYAGAANYPMLMTLLLGERVKGHESDYEKDLTKIHKQFFVGDKPIGKEFDENGERKVKAKMICSEFVSKVTIVSLIELNIQISKKILEHYASEGNTRYDNEKILERLTSKENKISKELVAYAKGKRYFGKEAEITKAAEKQWEKILKAEGYRQEEIELTIRLGNKEILDLPYSKKERLKAIHPGRMIQLLVDKGCAVKIGLPPKLAKVVNIVD